MDVKVPDRLLRVIEKETEFCLLSHADPDGDCIGSQLALAHFLRRIGKEVHLYSPGPFERPEIREYQHQFSERFEESVRRRDPVAIVLDCSSVERVGNLAEDLEGLSTVVVIDHHSSGNSFGNLHFIDPALPAVTLLVQSLIETMGYAVHETEAKWILFGFCTDTGFFRHLDPKGASVLGDIARLAVAGASPKQIYGMIYGARPLAARILLGRLLARTESYFDDQLLLTYETLDDARTFGIANRDSDTLYQQLQTVKGCEAVVLIREEENRWCTVGLRSNSRVDVGAIAKSFGGGGHARAAGFSWNGTREDIKRQLLEIYEKRLG